MNLFHTAMAWLASHPVEDIAAVVYVAMVALAHVPAKYAKSPVVGAAVRILDRVSAIAHASDDATFKLPGFASEAVKAVVAEVTK